MIKLAAISLLVCIAAGQLQKGRLEMLRPFEVQDDVENEAEIVEAAVLLPGTGNLYEKRLPVLRLISPNYIGPQGVKNLAEHSQLSPEDEADTVPAKGRLNLHEKVLLTDQEIARYRLQPFVQLQQRYP